MTVIQPCIYYALTVWGYASQVNIDKIQRLQNRAARMVTGNYDFINFRGIDLVKDLGWMNIIQRRNYFICILMFKAIHGLAPDYIANDITMLREVSTRPTRSFDSIDVYVPHARLECYKKSFGYIGPKTWNKLPNNIKECQTLATFKTNLKAFIIS